MTVHDQLLGSTQLVLSISLEPGESIVGETGEFAWMTDSIQMTVSSRSGLAGGRDAVTLARTFGESSARTLRESSAPLSAYTAKGAAGIVAFASRLPGSILGIEVMPGCEYLVHRRAFLAGTPGVEVTTGFQQPLRTTATEAGEFILRRIGGRGRAWVALSGDVVKRDLAAGTSLRTHPWHIGMSEASIAVQMAELRPTASTGAGDDAHQFAVLSGPGSVWLQSMQLLASPQAQLAASVSSAGPAAEGTAGPATTHRHSQHRGP